MNRKRWGILLLTLLVFCSGNTSFADNQWKQPTYVYGAGLSQAQIEETATLLGVETLESVYAIPVEGMDLVRFLQAPNTGDDSMISSVLVTKEKEGTGLQVYVETPRNITQITPEMYKNAAITAGVSDATLKIASPVAVTGESALSGIYKAYEANGEKLDQDRMAVAQEELETANRILQENKDKEGFDADVLNQLIIEIKQALAALKDEHGDLVTRDELDALIQELVIRFDLQNIITREQIDQLIALFMNYQKTGAIDAETVKEQLKQFSEEAGERIKGLIEDAKESGLLDRILDFFKELFVGLIDLVKGLLN